MVSYELLDSFLLQLCNLGTHIRTNDYGPMETFIRNWPGELTFESKYPCQIIITVQYQDQLGLSSTINMSSENWRAHEEHIAAGALIASGQMISTIKASYPMLNYLRRKLIVLREDFAERIRAATINSKGKCRDEYDDYWAKGYLAPLKR